MPELIDRTPRTPGSGKNAICAKIPSIGNFEIWWYVHTSSWFSAKWLKRIIWELSSLWGIIKACCDMTSALGLVWQWDEQACLGVCDSPAIQTLPSMEEEDCQKRCRADKDCRFYSSSPKACHLHSSCPPERIPCQGAWQRCSSGPNRPPLNKLPGNCKNNVTTSTTATITSTGRYWLLEGNTQSN